MSYATWKKILCNLLNFTAKKATHTPWDCRHLFHALMLAILLFYGPTCLPFPLNSEKNRTTSRVISNVPFQGSFKVNFCLVSILNWIPLSLRAVRKNSTFGGQVFHF